MAMHCPKCGIEKFDLSSPCPNCGFSGEAASLERLIGINFLLNEIGTWDDVPAIYRSRLVSKYNKRKRAVEVQLGLRQPPFDRVGADLARLELSNIRAFRDSDLAKWEQRGWLTAAAAGRLLRETNERIECLQERLEDAPPAGQEGAYSYDKARHRQLAYQLELLEVLNEKNRLASESVYEEALAALTADLHQVEIKLGLRRPAQVAEAPERVATIAAPATAEPPPPPRKPPVTTKAAPPPRPPRQPLSWDRVWETLLSERTLRAILFLGATLLFAAAVSLVVWNWETFPPWLQVTFLASFTAGFYGLGWYVRTKMRLRVSGIALSGVASLLVPLDFYAFYLSGGFLDLLWSDVWLLTSAVCLAAYLLTVYLIQAEFFGYLVGLAAGSLLAASLRFVGVETVWWPMLLSGLALGLALTAVFLARLKAKRLNRWQILRTPFWHLAVLGATAILALSSGLGLNGRFGDDDFLTSLAVSWWLGGALYLLAVTRFRVRAVGIAAAVAFPVAALLTQQRLYAVWDVSAAWYGLGWALLTPLYLLAGRRLLVQAGAESRQWRSDLLKAHGRTALVSCVLLILAAFGWSLGDSGAMGVVHLILALAMVLAARLWQRPNYLAVASLFLMSSTAGLVSSAGGALGHLGLGWALLAVGHIAAAIRLSAISADRGQADPLSPYMIPVFRAGWVIGALALLPPLFTFERSILSYTLANWIAVNGWLAMLVHEERLRLDRFWPTLWRWQLRLPALTFQWIAALLLPLWLWLAWTNGRAAGPLMGIAFVSVALMTLVLGGRLWRIRVDYGRPWFISAHLSAAIGVGSSMVSFDQPAFSILFLLATTFYFLSTRILHNRWWLVAAGFTFAIGFGFGLDWLNVPVEPLMLALALVVLAYVAGPILLNRYLGLSLKYQEPLRFVAYVVGALLFFFSVLHLLTAERTDALLLWMAATEAVLAATAAIFAWIDQEEGFGHVAAWLSVVSGGLIAVAFSQGRGSSAAKAAVLAILYIVAERLLHRAALKGGWRRRALAGALWRLFRRPLLTAGWGVSFIAVFLALFRNMLWLGGGRVRETWAIIGLLLIVGLYLVSSWLYRRYPRMSGRRVWWAAALIFFPWTLLTHMGWYLWDAPQSLSRYAISWVILALGLSGIGTLLTAPAVDRRWTRPPKVIAHWLLPFALIWGSGDSATSSVTFGLAVLFYLLAVLSDRLSQLRAAYLFKRPEPAMPRRRFLYPAAFLVPAWGAYLLDTFAPGSSGSAYGVLMLAFSLPFLLLGQWVERRVQPFGRPLYIVACGTAVLGTALTVPDQPILIGALLFDAFLGVVSARLFKQPLWLYVTVATIPMAVLLTLDEWAIPANRFGWGLLGVSQGFLLISWWLSNWKRTEKEKLVQKVAPAAQPFLLGGFWLLLLAIPLSSQDRIGVQVGYVAAAFIFIQLAVWLKEPVLSAAAAGLLTVPYYVTIANIGLAVVNYGLALWPLIVVYLVVGYGLDKLVGTKPPGLDEMEEDALGILRPFPWESPELWSNAALGRLLHWWAFPFYAIASLGAALAVILSLNDPARLTMTLILAAAVSGWATYYFRLRGWLLATVAAVQLAVLSGYWWLDWWQRPSQVALIFLPVTFLTALIGLMVEQRLNERSPDPGGWSRPFFIMLAVDVLIGQMISLNFGFMFLSDAEGIWITLGHTLLLGGLAAWWGSGRLANFTTLLGFMALVQFLFFRNVSLATWPTALALMAVGYGLTGYFLRYLRKREIGWVQRPSWKIWEQPLLMGGWIVSGLSLLALGTAGLNVIRLAFRSIFLLPLLTPEDIVWVQAMVAVLSLLGLFYLAAAVVERIPRLGYIAMGMMLAAWSLEWALVWGQREVQYYAVPAGAYLLLVGYLEWHNGSRGLARWIDYSALLLLLGTSFWQSLGPMGWTYALLMGFEGLMITWWGSTRRLRRFLYAGVAGVTVDVSSQLIQPLLTATNRWIIFGIVGIFLVSLAILVERRLENVLALTKDVRRRLEHWE